MLASLLRLGFVANFISEPVLVGFKAGIGLVIVLDQLPKLLGVHFPKTGFFRNLRAPRPAASPRPPGDARRRGRDDRAAARTRALPSEGPGAARRRGRGNRRDGPPRARGAGRRSRRPDSAGPAVTRCFRTSRSSARLWPGALGIALMSFTETIAAARAFARSRRATAQAQPGAARDGPRQRGRRLLRGHARGRRHVPDGGEPPRGRAHAGRRARHGGGRPLVTMLFLAPWIGLMPQATLAAVVIVYSIGLIQPAEFRAILDVRRTEFVWALTAFAGVVLLGTLRGSSSPSWFRSSPSPTRWPIRRSGSSGASPAPTSSGRAPRSTRRTRVSRACCCCGSRGGSSSPTRGGSPRRCGRSSPRRIRRSSRST